MRNRAFNELECGGWRPFATRTPGRGKVQGHSDLGRTRRPVIGLGAGMQKGVKTQAPGAAQPATSTPYNIRRKMEPEGGKELTRP